MNDIEAPSPVDIKTPARSKRIVAIIGAGVAGITTARQCLDQGLTVVVFEKTDFIGGLWRFQPDLDQDGIASVMRSTIINTSKELTAFSDFPPPRDFPNMMHNSRMIEYLDLYAESFNFHSYVRFRHEIVSLEPAPDHAHSGAWSLTYRNLAAAESPEIPPQTERFDAVAICTGHHNTVNFPRESFPGVDQFQGRIMHTHSLKSNAGFEGKRVCIIGCGNSGGDAAVELSTAAKQVYLSTRRGAWVVQRVSMDGRSFDSYYQRRIVHFLLSRLPAWLTCTFLEWCMNFYMNHEAFGLKPKHRILEQHAFFNDALPNRILSGTIQVKPNVERFTKEGVVFKGEHEPTTLDCVIFATGYRIGFPFLSSRILPMTGANQAHLYKHQFIPHLSHPRTLAIIGLTQPQGSQPPIAELQARWFALLNAGGSCLTLPPPDKMERSIRAQEEAIQRKYYPSARHTTEVDWLPFMADLARRIGVHPSLCRTLLRDPRLWWALVWGQAAPYQYRLIGPNAWPKARETLLTIDDRISAGLATNHGREMVGNCWTNLSTPCIAWWMFCLVVGVAFLSGAGSALFLDWLLL